MRDFDETPGVAPQELHPLERRERLRKEAQGLAVGYLLMATQSFMRSWPVRLLILAGVLSLWLAIGYAAAAFLGYAPAGAFF